MRSKGDSRLATLARLSIGTVVFPQENLWEFCVHRREAEVMAV